MLVEPALCCRELSTDLAGTPRRRGRFPNQTKRARYSPKEWVMRSLKLILTASGFLTYFIGMIGISALTTSVVHSALAPRSMKIVPCPATLVGI